MAKEKAPRPKQKRNARKRVKRRDAVFERQGRGNAKRKKRLEQKASVNMGAKRAKVSRHKRKAAV